jgi:hypothetical protein
MLDRQPYSVIGVLPDTFIFPSQGPLHNNVPADMFVPIGFTAPERCTELAGCGTISATGRGLGLQPANVDESRR